MLRLILLLLSCFYTSSLLANDSYIIADYRMDISDVERNLEFPMLASLNKNDQDQKYSLSEYPKI